MLEVKSSDNNWDFYLVLLLLLPAIFSLFAESFCASNSNVSKVELDLCLDFIYPMLACKYMSKFLFWNRVLIDFCFCFCCIQALDCQRWRTIFQKIYSLSLSLSLFCDIVQN